MLSRTIVDAVLLFSVAAAAPFRLASIFQNGMVIQRDQPIAVWGWSSPSSPVYGSLWRPADNATAAFNASATADASGFFVLSFPPQIGEDLHVQSERAIAVSTAPISPNCLLYQHYCRGAYTYISNVRIGDVILCTGQSNMQVNVGFAFNSSEELAAANAYTNAISIFQVPATSMSVDAPLDDFPVTALWQGASNTTLPEFSATCWFSGKALYDSRPPGSSVPLGLIETCWGGTPIKVCWF
jgi:sialate O-acetylesterase